MLEQAMNCKRNDSLLIGTSPHCVCLTTAGLPICKNRTYSYKKAVKSMHIYSIFYSVNSATMWTNTVDKNMNNWNITKQRLTLGCRARVQDHDTKE
jgi:hypothetical protein